MIKRLLTILTFTAAFTSSCAFAKEEPKEDINTYELLNIFGEVMERTKASYVEEETDKNYYYYKTKEIKETIKYNFK